MKRLLFLTLVSVSFLGASICKSQDVEGGLFLGATNYQGELANPEMGGNLGETRPGVGVIFRYYFNPKLNLKANIYYGNIAEDDKNHATGERGRRKRNLSFESHIAEFSAQIEYNILRYVNNSDLYGFAPYVFTGISIFNFNPKAEYQGEMVELQPIGTEGQGRPGGPELYSLTQLSIPFGGGIKYSVGDGWNIGLEIGLRKTFTDYLDDVSTDYPSKDIFGDNEMAKTLSDPSIQLREQEDYRFSEGNPRGNPETDDWYSFTGITITKTFREQRCMGF